MAEPLFPIKQRELFQMYEKAVASFWTVSEIDLEHDLDDLAKLTQGESRILRNILSFFAASDIIVNDNIIKNLWSDCVYPEAQLFYSFQLGVESIHTVMYNTLIERYYGSDSSLFDGIENNIHIKNKADFCVKYMDSGVSHAKRLVAYTFVEGLFFASSFASIYYFKKRGLMPGLTVSNEFISRDESLHASFSCLLYKTMVNDKHIERLSQAEVHQIVSEAVDHEICFVGDTISEPVLGFNADLMSTYVKYVADLFVTMLGYEKLYHATNPFEFMDMISLNTKTNFFEARVSEYSKLRDCERKFDLTADF